MSAQPTTRAYQCGEQRVRPDDLAQTKRDPGMALPCVRHLRGDVARGVAPRSEKQGLNDHFANVMSHTFIDRLRQARLAQFHMRPADQRPITRLELYQTRNFGHYRVRERPTATVVDDHNCPIQIGSQPPEAAIRAICERSQARL